MAVLGAALILSSCAGGEENVESVTVALTTETAFEQVTEETTSAKAFLGDYTEQASEEETVVICGESYGTDTSYISVNMSEFSAEDEENIKKLTRLSSVAVDSPEDMDFLRDIKGLETLTVRRPKRDIKEYIGFFKELELKTLMVFLEDYTEADYDECVTAMPDTEVFFYGVEPLIPEDADLTLYADPFITPGAPSETNEAGIKYGFLTAYLTNNTDGSLTAEKAEIQRLDSDKWVTAAEFDVGLDIGSGETAVFEVTNDLFDYAVPGRHKIIFTADGKEYEREFFVDDSYSLSRDNKFYDLSLILDEEQMAVFEQAQTVLVITGEYAENHTPEDLTELFCQAYTRDYAERAVKERYTDENGQLYVPDYGRYLVTFWGQRFSLIYSDENTIVIRNTVTDCDIDSRCKVTYTSVTCRLVKTENGWRFDRFQFWD